jgi:hypothetical protein
MFTSQVTSIFWVLLRYFCFHTIRSLICHFCRTRLELHSYWALRLPLKMTRPFHLRVLDEVLGGICASRPTMLWRRNTLNGRRRRIPPDSDWLVCNLTFGTYYELVWIRRLDCVIWICETYYEIVSIRYSTCVNPILVWILYVTCV